MVEEDPVTTDPAHYRMLVENQFVRVVEYLAATGGATLHI